MKEHILECEVITPGVAYQKNVLIPRVDNIADLNAKTPYQLRRRQFPVRPCFAMTINKSQGQTFQKIGVMLDEDCFAHGQLYVALSRAKNQLSVRIVKKEGYSTTQNVVNQMALQRAGILEQQEQMT